MSKEEIQSLLLDRESEKLVDKLCQEVKDICQVVIDYGLRENQTFYYFLGEHTMNAVIEKGNLIITIPVNAKPTASESGKTLQVASSHGNTPTAVVVDGSPLIVGVNAYIRNPDYKKP